MGGLGFVISMFQPPVYRHPSKDLLVVAHVDDFLVKDLEWFFDNLAQKFELKRSMITKWEEEIKCLGRTIRWTYDVTPEGKFEVEGDERHVQLLMQERQHCKNVDTPISKAGQESINTGEELNEDEARRARRAIARMNYMPQDRPVRRGWSDVPVQVQASRGDAGHKIFQKVLLVSNISVWSDSD